MNQNLVKRKVLVAAQSFETRLAVGAALAERGYSVATVSNGLAACTSLPSDGFDLLLVSADILGFKVAELCRMIREITSVPIIVYPGSEQIAERLEAFDAGADDYITQGAGFEEVLARVKAVLRRYESHPDHAVAASPDAYTANEITNRPGQDTAGSKLSLKYRNRPREYEIQSGTSVLVVDSDPDARKYGIRLLRKLGYLAIEADSCLQGILTAKQYRPMLVITELHFDHLSGFELIRVLRSYPATHDTKVIVASDYGKPEYLDRARKLGISDYIIKPLSLMELSIRVQWALQQAAAA